MDSKKGWELIPGQSAVLENRVGTERLSVPGGWIVRSTGSVGLGPGFPGFIAIAQTFVSDPAHGWTLEE